MSKKDVAEGLNKVLADTFVLYFKTHSFHWNVTGPRFHSLHEMFEEQYTEMWEAMDVLADLLKAQEQNDLESAKVSAKLLEQVMKSEGNN